VRPAADKRLGPSRPRIASKSDRSGTGADMANPQSTDCHGESYRSRFGNPAQESNFQRLDITRLLQKWPAFYSDTSHCVSKRPIWRGRHRSSAYARRSFYPGRQFRPGRHVPSPEPLDGRSVSAPSKHYSCIRPKGARLYSNLDEVQGPRSHPIVDERWKQWRATTTRTPHIRFAMRAPVSLRPDLMRLC
jgi:hypothetical protein